MKDSKSILTSISFIVAFLGICMAVHYLGVVKPEWLVPNPFLDFIAPLSFKNHVEIRLSFLVTASFMALCTPSNEMTAEAITQDPRKRYLLIFLYLAFAVLLFSISKFPLMAFASLYPLVFIGFLATSFILANLFKKSTPGLQVTFGFQPVKVKIQNEYSFHWYSRKDGYLNIENIFRSMGLFGGAGAGKTYTIVEPLIEQAIQKGMAMMIFDFKMAQNFSHDPKDWSLTRWAYMALILNNAPRAKKDQAGNWLEKHSRNSDRRNFYIVNFKDIRYSHRVNPIHPDYLLNAAYANESAMTLLTNLNPKWIKDRDFWADAAIIYLRSIIWFLRCEFPNFCTIPHAIAIALMDHNLVTAMLALNEETFETMASLNVAIKQNAEGQIAGMVSALQTPITRISSPDIAWVLSENDFSLNLNDPENPAILGLGSDPELQETYSPVCSLIASVCRKFMNKPNRVPSLFVLDEAPQLYIPKLADLPATARSNKLGVIVCGQDMSQFEVMFGKDVSTSLIANLGNLLFGQVNDLQTAKMVSEIIGNREKVNRSVNAGKSMGDSLSKSSGENFSIQKEALLPPHEIMTLPVGQFVGKVASVSDDPRTKKPLYSSFFNVRPEINRKTVEHDFPQLLKDPNNPDRKLSREEADQLAFANFKQIRADAVKLVDRCARTACLLYKADERRAFPQHFQNGTRVVSTLGDPLFEGIKVDEETGAVSGIAIFERPLE